MIYAELGGYRLLFELAFVLFIAMGLMYGVAKYRDCELLPYFVPAILVGVVGFLALWARS